MSRTGYDDPDLDDGLGYDDGPMVVEPDESRHYDYAPPTRRGGRGRYGPTGRDQWDEDGEPDNRESRRSGFNVQALTGVIIVGAGVASLVWVFAGPVVVLAAGGAGVVTWIGKKVVGWRRSRTRNGRGGAGRAAGQARGGAAQRGQRRTLGEMLGLGGRAGKKAAARRAGLLAGMGTGGVGGGRGRGGRGSGSGVAGRGAKPGGGAKPKSGGGLLNKLKGKGAGRTAGAGSAGMPAGKPRGAGPGRHRPKTGPAGNPLTRMRPGAKGRAARTAHTNAKARSQTAAKKARQARIDNRKGRSAKKDVRSQMRQARFNRRQLNRKNRAVRRKYRSMYPGVVRRSARFTGRVLRKTIYYGGVVPLWFVARYGVGAPARLAYRMAVRPAGRFLFIRPSTAIAAWAGRVRRGRARARMLRKRYKAIFVRPARQARRAAQWAAFKAWFAPAWLAQLRALARKRGIWVAGLGLLAMMLAGFVYAGRKAREWAWDGKKARHPFDPEPAGQQNTYPYGEAQPDPATQPDPAKPGSSAQPDPAQTNPTKPGPILGPIPKPQEGPWSFGFDSDDTTTGPAPGTVPTTTEGVPQVATLTAQPGTGISDNLEIPAGMHPVFGALCADARVLEGMFDPNSFPDLAIYLNSLSAKIRTERDKWQVVGDQLLSRFPGFNLAQEFAGDVHSAYTDLAVIADNVFQGYRDQEESTFARWLDPRVNEEYADVTRWPGVSDIDPQTLVDGSKMHGSHTIWLSSVEMNLVGWFPTEGQEQDYVIELLHWLQSLHPFFVARARYAKNFVTNGLVHGFPIEDGVADITMQVARGFADLADKGFALAAGYEARNPYDMNRRYQPKVNESKRDRGNSQMTNAGA